jgi:phosphate transport system permease protein
MLDRYRNDLWGELATYARSNELSEDILDMVEKREDAFADVIEEYQIELLLAGRQEGPEVAEMRARGEAFQEVEERLRDIMGPLPGEEFETPHKQYGATRWDRAREYAHELIYRKEYDHSDPESMGTQILVPRVEQFVGTDLEPLFAHVEEHLEEMVLPRLTFYWRFFVDESYDAHYFGGIGAQILGTLYLTFGAMLFAAPLGVLTALYLAEYAGEGRLVSLVRTCISTLAGVPSVVFGLFGLVFFINATRVTDGPSVVVGCMTLGLLVLPTVIRASEEAILAVPHTYREAALSLGATKWRATFTVVLPAALPGVLTSIIISMGRAAGETAPILFTAGVAMGSALSPLQALSRPTVALPYSIYSIVAEHEAIDRVIHVPYGMAATLVAMVLLLNLTAIILRARISKKLRG